MEPAAAKFLMALIILTRSSAFLFSKFVLEELAPFQALGFRFTLAFLVMGLLLRRHLLRAWKKDAYLGPKSLGLGLLLFAVMGAEMRSLLTAEIHTVALISDDPNQSYMSFHGLLFLKDLVALIPSEPFFPMPTFLLLEVQHSRDLNTIEALYLLL